MPKSLRDTLIEFFEEEHPGGSQFYFAERGDEFRVEGYINMDELVDTIARWGVGEALKDAPAAIEEPRPTPEAILAALRPAAPKPADDDDLPF